MVIMIPTLMNEVVFWRDDSPPLAPLALLGCLGTTGFVGALPSFIHTPTHPEPQLNLVRYGG